MEAVVLEDADEAHRHGQGEERVPFESEDGHCGEWREEQERGERNERIEPRQQSGYARARQMPRGAAAEARLDASAYPAPTRPTLASATYAAAPSPPLRGGDRFATASADTTKAAPLMRTRTISHPEAVVWRGWCGRFGLSLRLRGAAGEPGALMLRCAETFPVGGQIAQEGGGRVTHPRGGRAGPRRRGAGRWTCPLGIRG